jgi:hypothetical protein
MLNYNLGHVFLSAQLTHILLRAIQGYSSQVSFEMVEWSMRIKIFKNVFLLGSYVENQLLLSCISWISDSHKNTNFVK